jgi:multisubunit Na+/H+ antiporter MnhB subunit
VEKGYAKLSKGASYTYAYDSGVKTNVLETAALGSTSFVLVSTSHSGITFNQANHTVSFDPFIPVGTHKYQVKLINSNYYDSVVECSVTITKGTMKVIDLTD